MRAKRLAYVVIALGLLGTQSRSQQTGKNVTREQTRFGLEEAVIQPIPVPNEVLSILRDDPEVRRSRCVSQVQSADKISALWFEASQIHLAGPNEIDLLVKAKDGCLFGANIGPFWIFRKRQQGYELMLAVSALGVELLPRKTNGHADISASAVAGGRFVSVFYKFDGHRYKESGNKVQEIK